MNTGTYKARVNSPDGIARLGKIKLLLERDGIPYTSDLDDNWVIIRANGISYRHMHRKPSVPGPPALLTAAQCTKRAAAAQLAVDNFRAMFRRQLAAQSLTHEYYTYRNTETYYGYAQARARKVGRIVARLMARHKGQGSGFRLTKQDYALLDKGLGHRVKRESQLGKYYSSVLEYVVKVEAHGRWPKLTPTHDEPEESKGPTQVEQFQLLKADLEHWTEMLTLANGRALYAEYCKGVK